MIEGSKAAQQIRDIAHGFTKEEIAEIAAKAKAKQYSREDLFKLFEKSLRDTIARNGEKDPNMEITELTTMKDMGIDSLDTVELVMDIEDTLEIEIDDEDLKKCKNVGELIDLTEKTVEEKPFKDAAIAKYIEQRKADQQKKQEEFEKELEEDEEWAALMKEQQEVEEMNLKHARERKYEKPDYEKMLGLKPTESEKDRLPKEQAKQVDKTKLK